MFDFGKRFFFLQVGVQIYEILSADVTTALVTTEIFVQPLFTRGSALGP